MDRSILVKIFSSLLCFSTMYYSCFSQANNNILETLVAEHPRLFANDKKIAVINSQTDSVTKQLLYIVKADADKKLTEPNIQYENGKSNMITSRNVQGRIIVLALAYRLFNHEKYLDKAKAELMQLASLEDWGLSHFLDVGEASLAAGIGYDWLHKALSESERKTIADAIKNNALLPSLQVKETEGNKSWVNGNFNWNPVCHGGLMVGALAIAEKERELSNQILARGLKNLPLAGDAYSPDGAFAEGPSYWSYGTSFYVMIIEALRSSLGTSYGLEKIPGFLKTADYNLQVVGATGEDFNYSDYHMEHGNEPVMLWFAKELKRADLSEPELRSIKKMHGLWLKKSAEQSTVYALPTEGGKISQSRHTGFELLWWNPALLKQNKTENLPSQWTADGLMSIGIMRSAWNDTNATFVALKGGTPDNSHGHMDGGSFILETQGVRWASDLGTESYDKMRAAKLDLWSYAQNSSRWSTFKVGPEGHNILRFDNNYQLITGNGKVKQLTRINAVMGCEADLSSLYLNKASKVTRTALLHPNKSVSIQDEWKTKDSAVTYTFQWITKANVTKTSSGLLLQQNGRSLQLNIEQPAIVNDFTIEIEDISKPKNIQDSPNPGMSRIIIKINTAANSEGKLFLKANTTANKNEN